MNQGPLCFVPAALLAVAVLPDAAVAQRISPEQREEAIVEISELLVEQYVFEDVAEECADLLYRRLDEGAYDGMSYPGSFAKALTEDLQAASSDRHLRVSPSRNPPREKQDEPRPADEEHEIGPEERARMAEGNFGFRRVEVLEGNVGYLDLRGFQPAEVARPTAEAAMAFLANTRAIVIDLRQNGGGNPSMVELLSSYFFPPRTQLNTLYDRVTDKADESWTHDEVAGRRMLGRPLYVLTSGRTFSAAEAFTYNLKARGRATVVGENTGGGAHAGDTRPIGSSLTIFVPRYRAINPVTGSNWEGTGIAPDIAVGADDALKVALEEARKPADS